MNRAVASSWSGVLAILFATGAVAAQTTPPPSSTTARPTLTGDLPFSWMHTILEKTIFKVDVMSLDVCLDRATATAIGRFVAGGRSNERDDSIARAVIRAPAAVARIRFLRNISFSQFLDGIGEEQKKAVHAGLLADSVHRMVADSLPHWFAFLDSRDIHDGDLIFYEFDGDTLRTVYRDADGTVLLDRADVGRDRRTSVLATYVAPGSGFRKGLIGSLNETGVPPADGWACSV